MTWEEEENYYMTAEDMSVAGELFGMRYVDGGAPNGCIEIYIEDDETFYRKITVNHVWLDDLISIATQMKKKVDNGEIV